MRRRAQRAVCLLTVAGFVAGVGCGDDGGSDSGPATASTSEDDGDGEAETGEPEAASGDSCEHSLLVQAPTSFTSTLRDATPPSFPSSCGATGPIVYMRVKIEDRVDLTIRARGRAYTPKLAVLLPGCVSAQADPARLLGCVDALPRTFMDLGPDVEVLITLGIADDDPALELSAGEGELDPLDFELDIDLRPVLGEGQTCGAGQGRCEAGTVCLAADEDGDQIQRCRRPPADSCVAPGQLAVPEPGAASTIMIPSDEAHSDAHEHSCAGWRRPERVEQLELPASLPVDATLVVRANDPRVGLALRESSCLPELELACAPALPSAAQTELSWGGEGELSALAEAGGSPLLFIELPRAPDDDDEGGSEAIGPISVSVEITLD